MLWGLGINFQLFMKHIILPLFILLGLNSLGAQDAVTRGKELFGDLKARQIGPALMSGRITDLEVHPSNDRIIYAGTAGGGVWKSSDGGARFQSIFDDYCQSIGAVVLDPSQPDKIVWVGTGETWTRNSVSTGNGIYRSGDGGTNWQKMGLENSERIGNIIVHPKNSDIVYVAVLGALWSDSEDRGVYKTTDGGRTWNKILYVNQTTGCADLAIDPANPGILYASFWEFRRTPWSFSSGGHNSALYKSTDEGKTWAKIHNGLPAGQLGRMGIAVAPSNPNILYTVVESEQNKDKGLYRSDDAGASWKLLSNDFGLVVRPFYFSRIVVDPKNPEVVVKGGLFGSISRDGGKTFKNLGPMHADIHDIAFDIKNSDRMYVGTDGGVYRTWDGGTTMEMVENIPVSQFYHVTVDYQTPYNVYGGLQDNGSWYGPSSSPGGIEARDWHSVGAGDGFRVYPHPTKRIVYSEMQGADNIWRLDVERQQVKTIQPLPVEGDPKLRFNWNTPITTSPNKPDRIYVGSQFLHKSDDMGDNWVKISPDLTTNDPKKQDQSSSGGLSRDNSGAENHCTIFTISESELDEKIIWAGTDDGQVQVTQDGGKTWKNVTAAIPNLPKNTWCYHIEPSHFSKGSAYAVFDGHSTGDMKAYAYKTTDFGATWNSIITSDIEGFTRSLKEDYVNENLLFLGTELGLYVTVNGGQSWMKFTNNVPAVAVMHIAQHKGTNDIILATHGRGVIIIDDVSPLRQINETTLNKELHFFDLKPVTVYEENGFGGASGETQFVGPNPSKAARFIYHLKKRHTFGKMTMEIQDLQGNKLSELTPGKSKGINVVEWNFRTKTPKVAGGKTFSAGGMTAPRVPAGKYKVVIQKGNETFSQEFEVKNDPTSPMSPTDRKELDGITQKLFDMNQDLAYLVYELDEIVNKAQEVKTKSPSSATNKVVDPLIKDFTSLKESLVITTGDNYVDTAEPQLREKMGTLYGRVANSFYKLNSSEMDNLKLIENRFNKAKTDFANMKTKHMAKLNQLIIKNKLTPVSLQKFEDYIAAP